MTNRGNKKMNKIIQAIFVAFIVTAVALLMTGCVSDKIIMASKECSANRTAAKITEISVLGGQMDSKDIIIMTLADKLAGDPCADMLIAEINGKNKLLNAATLGATAVLPGYFNYKTDKALYQSLAGQNRNSTINLSGISSGDSIGGEGGSGNSGQVLIGIHSDINTGTLNSYDFEKGVLGGEGDINDADEVNATNDGLL
jgi:hypothetical protein